MDTLTSAPVADVLARLFDEAKATDGPLDERFAEVADDDKALAEFLALEAKDYKGMYRQLADYYLNVSAEFGQFLYVCARARQAARIVEFGTSFGVYLTYLRNPANGYRTIPLPFGAHRGNEMSVCTA